MASLQILVWLGTILAAEPAWADPAEEVLGRCVGDGRVEFVRQTEERPMERVRRQRIEVEVEGRNLLLVNEERRLPGDDPQKLTDIFRRLHVGLSLENYPIQEWKIDSETGYASARPVWIDLRVSWDGPGYLKIRRRENPADALEIRLTDCLLK